MTIVRETRDDEAYDAIVIGGGLAGLSAAAHLAQADRKVVVLEQDARPGAATPPSIARGWCSTSPRTGRSTIIRSTTCSLR